MIIAVNALGWIGGRRWPSAVVTGYQSGPRWPSSCHIAHSRSMLQWCSQKIGSSPAVLNALIHPKLPPTATCMAPWGTLSRAPTAPVRIGATFTPSSRS